MAPFERSAPARHPSRFQGAGLLKYVSPVAVEVVDEPVVDTFSSRSSPP